MTLNLKRVSVLAALIAGGLEICGSHWMGYITALAVTIWATWKPVSLATVLDSLRRAPDVRSWNRSNVMSKMPRKGSYFRMTNTEYRAKRARDRKRRRSNSPEKPDSSTVKQSLQVDHIVQVHEKVTPKAI